MRRVGFSPQVRQIQIQIGQTVDQNVSLAEQAVQLSAVTVQESAVQGTTRTSEVGTNISRQQIADLPNFERNVLDLAKLAPGVTATPVNSTDKTFASGGQPSSSVNVFVGTGIASARVAHSYFLLVDDEGNIVASTPEITGQY